MPALCICTSNSLICSLFPMALLCSCNTHAITFPTASPKQCALNSVKNVYKFEIINLIMN